jgi:DUF1009 family protein
MAEGPLAIFAGAGGLPRAIGAEVAATGREVVYFPLRGQADIGAFADTRHHEVRIGEIAGFLKKLKDAGAREIVFAGQVHRPALKDLTIDRGAIRALPLLFRSRRGGDDAVLATLTALLETVGVRVLSAAEVAPRLVAPDGLIAGKPPSAQDMSEIRLGFDVLAALGPLDVGQSVVVVAGRVAAIEAAEGTDAMLARVADLTRMGRLRASAGGVLVKAPKPGQQLRHDMPVIGAQTVASAAAAGLSRIALGAKGVLLADGTETVRAAERAGLSITGVADPRFPP